MPSPPGYLRSILDGASEAAIVVTSSGTIWHMNESSQRLFNVFGATVDSDTPISTYLSFCTSHPLNGGQEPALPLSWDDVTNANPDTFINNKRTATAIGIPTEGGGRRQFPATIKLVRVRVAITQDAPEETRSGQSSASDTIRRDQQNLMYYCLYIEELNPARQQIASLEEAVARLSATKDAILCASGQILLLVDDAGSIQSVSGGSSQLFGYEYDSVAGQNINTLIQERGGDLSLDDLSRREVQGRHSDGSLIDIEVGFARISTGNMAVMIKNISALKERQEAEVNEKILQGREERSHMLDAAFDPMFCTNKNGIITMVNRATIEEFGWQRNELIGQNVSMVVGGSHRQHHDSYVQRYNETKEKRMIGKKREIQCVRKDHTEFTAELGLAEIPTGFCGFIRKTTRQKMFEHRMLKAKKEMAAQLEHQENITRGILDASFDALFVINDRGIIQDVNETSSKVFGWTREEFLGKNISIIMKSDIAASHDKYLQNYLKSGIKKMIGTQREVTAQRKDKTTFPCVLGLSHARDLGLFCGFIRDLTSEKAAQSEIVESEKLMVKILDASFDALFLINEKGIIQRVNAASSRVFGWTKEEFLGKNINMIMPEGHARNHDQYLRKYINTGFKKIMGKQREVEAKRKDGTCFPCILGLSEMQTNDGSKQFVGFIKDVTVQKSLLIAEAEREASDSLLHNILPEHIAHRLKQDPSHIADHYENTTILFADIVGFTDRATKMSPHDVVTMLNDLFSRFDYLVGSYDLNKVKTIGDCYMVTSIPVNDLEHDGCARVCRFALDMMKAVRAFNNSGPLHGPIELRVGVACGQVVAGVVGTKRFLFDMWGDAVNVAARMEQHGLAGQIQATKEVVDNAGSDFTFEFRGPLNVKGKGIMDTYLLKSAKKPVETRHSVYQRWKPNSQRAVRANSNNL